MKKQSKKNRRNKVPDVATTKRNIAGAPIVFVALAVVVTIGFWGWRFRTVNTAPAATPIAEAGAAHAAAPMSKSEFHKLEGRWQRADGGYVLAIKNITESGAMEAAYFNPKAIHVARAEASRDGDVTNIFIELRDVYYPGSAYMLSYDTASDRLTGIYYQAVANQQFEVAFERMK
jgi:hypothetical protein